MGAYQTLTGTLQQEPRKWLVTGVAGFIGSHLLETLLKLDQRVTGLDNFSTGKAHNLDQVRDLVTPDQWARFRFIQGDIADLESCRVGCDGAEFVLHQAALGSVPRSMEDPLSCHRSNVTGFLNMLVAARDAGVKRFVFASSSAVYGDEPGLPKSEERIGKPLSPYAASKYMNEVYASAFAQAYRFSSIGLRYFNVFGPRQDPNGAYAAVIPRWTAALLRREPVFVNGDGETSRDFCYVQNVVRANLLAATTEIPGAVNECYNVALGGRTTLNELFNSLQNALRELDPSLPVQRPVYRDFRAGDVRHSLANIDKAARLLGYVPGERVHEGLRLAMDWYRAHLS
jgi:UDP-N-acetylglucosamine 4-epimerase